MHTCQDLLLGVFCHYQQELYMDTPKSSLEKPSEAVSNATENKVAPLKKEYGGPKGPEPTRFGDWEVGGRCSDF
jgi:hypothetical protein